MHAAIVWTQGGTVPWGGGHRVEDYIGWRTWDGGHGMEDIVHHKSIKECAARAIVHYVVKTPILEHRVPPHKGPSKGLYHQDAY